MNDRADHFAQTLASTVRNRRKSLRLRQEELAALADVSVRFVHSLEAAKPTVRLDKVGAVLDVLGLDLIAQARSGASSP